MIGFNDVRARDISEAIANGGLDEDLDAIESAIEHRKNSLIYPLCECGEKFLKPDVICVHPYDGVREATVHMSMSTYSKLDPPQ